VFLITFGVLRRSRRFGQSQRPNREVHPRSETQIERLAKHVWTIEEMLELVTIQSDINCGTGVPPVITAGTAVPRRDEQLFKSLCIVGS